MLGGCGTGRTSLLLRLRDLIGRTQAQYVDVERVATTPERFLTALRESSPFPGHPYGTANGAQPSAREAFDASLAFLDTARAPGALPATFLLDEFLELRTFESFPGLRSVLRDLIGALASSGNRFVLTSRYTSRALRLLRDAPSQFEIVHVAPLTAGEVRATLPGAHGDDHVGGDPSGQSEEAVEQQRDDLARLVQALSDGRPSYARAIAEDRHGPVAARRRRSRRAPSARCSRPAASSRRRCRFCYELRLHRARGYGALKAILEVLATGRAADAHRNRAAPPPHAGLDEGLSLLARGRRPRRRAPEAVQLSPTRCCVSGSGCTAVRFRPATMTSRGSCTATCCRACRTASPRWRSRAAQVEREKYSGIIEID